MNYEVIDFELWKRRNSFKKSRRILDKLTIQDIEKYFSNIDREGTCWLYKGDNRKGYPTFKGYPCHRIAYELYNNDTNEHLVIDHLCSVRWCQNPEHLEQVTRGENSIREIYRKRNDYIAYK